MGVSIVVGGQYGSEGKGKVTQHLARSRSARAVVRVGGTNSGHTSLGGDGERREDADTQQATFHGFGTVDQPPDGRRGGPRPLGDVPEELGARADELAAR